jgi:hypothetical protein
LIKPIAAEPIPCLSTDLFILKTGYGKSAPHPYLCGQKKRFQKFKVSKVHGVFPNLNFLNF